MPLTSNNIQPALSVASLYELEGIQDDQFNDGELAYDSGTGLYYRLNYGVTTGVPTASHRGSWTALSLGGPRSVVWNPSIAKSSDGVVKTFLEAYALGIQALLAGAPFTIELVAPSGATTPLYTIPAGIYEMGQYIGFYCEQGTGFAGTQCVINMAVGAFFLDLNVIDGPMQFRASPAPLEPSFSYTNINTQGSGAIRLANGAAIVSETANPAFIVDGASAVTALTMVFDNAGQSTGTGGPLVSLLTTATLETDVRNATISPLGGGAIAGVAPAHWTYGFDNNSVPFGGTESSAFTGVYSIFSAGVQFGQATLNPAGGSIVVTPPNGIGPNTQIVVSYQGVLVSPGTLTYTKTPGGQSHGQFTANSTSGTDGSTFAWHAIG